MGLDDQYFIVIFYFKNWKYSSEVWLNGHQKQGKKYQYSETYSNYLVIYCSYLCCTDQELSFDMLQAMFWKKKFQCKDVTQ